MSNLAEVKISLIAGALILVLLICNSSSAWAINCSEVKTSQKKYLALGQQELRNSLSSWQARKASFKPSPEHYKTLDEVKKCESNPKKYAKESGKPELAKSQIIFGKEVKCYLLRVPLLMYPPTFTEKKPVIDYEDSYRISQVIIYNNPECFDPGVVVKVQSWIKQHPSALND
jgi:hypothetical protein